MLSWLYRRKETYIDSFDFKKLKRIDRGDEDLRRALFDNDEYADIRNLLEKQITDARKDIEKDGNLANAVVCYYLLISTITGFRRGEQLQLRWQDIEHIEHLIGGDYRQSKLLIFRLKVLEMKLGIVIYTNDTETAWNAFRIANFALNKGDAVTVFLLGKGVECEQLDNTKFKLNEQMLAFVNNSGEIMACGTCLKIRNSESTELCPVSTMSNLYNLIEESDKLLTF